DGIRDKLVTGVQTCALPISGGTVIETLRVPFVRRTIRCLPGVQSLNVPTTETSPLGWSGGRVKVSLTSPILATRLRRITVAPCRSEERRVGKEGRLRVEREQ